VETFEMSDINEAATRVRAGGALPGVVQPDKPE